MASNTGLNKDCCGKSRSTQSGKQNTGILDFKAQPGTCNQNRFSKSQVKPPLRPPPQPPSNAAPGGSSEQRYGVCGSSAEGGSGIGSGTAQDLVDSMDKKYEEYRKKIQNDGFEQLNSCHAMQEMLLKPPWSAPPKPEKAEKPLKRRVCRPEDKIPSHHRNLQHPAASQEFPAQDSPSGQWGAPGQNEAIYQQQQQQHGSGMSPSGSFGQVESEQCLDEEVDGGVPYDPATDPCGCAAYEPDHSECKCCPPPPPAPEPKPRKPKPCQKKFSSPSNLRKKLYNYIENKPEDKNNPIGALIPFFDGTHDLSSCLSRGAQEALEPWEISQLTYRNLQQINACCDEAIWPTENEQTPSAAGCPSGVDEAKVIEEVECFKNIMPPDLTCQQQLDYMNCMGASDEAMARFRELQASSSQCDAAQAQGFGVSPHQSSSQPMANAPPPYPSGGYGSSKTQSPSSVGAQKTDSSCKVCRSAGPQSQDQWMDGLHGQDGTQTETNVAENSSTVKDSAGDGEEENEEDEKQLQGLSMFNPPHHEKPRTMAETFKLYKEHLGNIRRRYFGAVVKHIDSVEDITPETAAAMVISEDQNVLMKGAPAKLYEYLYPEHPSQPLLKIGEVTDPEVIPPGISNIVVPLVPPMMLETADYPGLEDPAMLDSPRVIQIGPSPNLADEPEPSEFQKPLDLVELVTGQTEQLSGLMDDPNAIEEEEAEESGAYEFDIKLNQAMPPHYSRFQIRGTQAPNWFPGYYFAFPSRAGVFCQDRIGGIIERAWEEVQPESVKPAGGAIIVGN